MSDPRIPPTEPTRVINNLDEVKDIPDGTYRLSEHALGAIQDAAREHLKDDYTSAQITRVPEEKVGLLRMDKWMTQEFMEDSLVSIGDELIDGYGEALADQFSTEYINGERTYPDCVVTRDETFPNGRIHMYLGDLAILTRVTKGKMVLFRLYVNVTVRHNAPQPA